MKTTVALGVLHHAVSVFVKLSAVFKIFICTLCKIVLIYKVIACVIRRVDIYHLNLAKICFLQQFQYFQIIALNVEVFGVVKVHASTAAIGFRFTIFSGWFCFIVTNRTQRLVYRCIGKKN